MVDENLREPPDLVERVVEWRRRDADHVRFPEVALHSSADKFVMQILWMSVRQNG